MLVIIIQTDLSVKSITYRKLRSTDMDQRKSDSKDSEMCAVDRLYVYVSVAYLNPMVLKYNVTLSSVLEHHAPLKVVTKTSRPTVPWYNELIVCVRKWQRKAERKWRRTCQYNGICNISKTSRCECFTEVPKHYCFRVFGNPSKTRSTIF